MYLFDAVYDRHGPTVGLLMVESVLATIVAIVAAVLLFPAHASMVSVFLVVIAQADTVVRLANRNRDDIWVRKENAWRANGRLTLDLVAVFAGVLAVFLAAAVVYPTEEVAVLFSDQLGAYLTHGSGAIVFEPFGELFVHNLLVLVTSFVFAFVFRHAGMLIVLVWNASVWGVVLPYLVGTSMAPTGWAIVTTSATVTAAMLPHLLVEASSYVLAAMGGTFLSVAVLKYDVATKEFARVIRAVVAIVAVSVLGLALGALLEATLPPLVLG